MQRIKSFEVDHTKLDRGFYVSRVDGDIVTYDMRFCKPNTGELLDHETMHTAEHMVATYMRNSAIADSVIYFGPMGCQTGFYLLVRDDVAADRVVEVLRDALQKTVDHTGDVFGNSEVECGNCKTLNLDKAKAACRSYLEVLTGVGTYK